MTGGRRKGKIPAIEWPLIVERHSRGEGFTEIARDYGCTPPAIRYIIGRVRQNPTHGRDEQSNGQAASLLSSVVEFDGGARVRAPLRNRIDRAVAEFLCAIDGATEASALDKKDSLRLACDNLMHAVARVRIELDRIPTSASNMHSGEAKHGPIGDAKLSTKVNHN
jgi:hypothetical protein